MLDSSIGSLTIIDANLPTLQVFWKGGRLTHVLSVTSLYNPPAAQRVNIRVTNPSKIEPALPTEEQLRILAIYDEMIAAGINIIKQ